MIPLQFQSIKCFENWSLFVLLQAETWTGMVNWKNTWLNLGINPINVQLVTQLFPSHQILELM